MPIPPNRKELTHDRIVEVAARVIRRAGYQGAGVADIMKEAGLTHGGFYAHFPSRDALLVEATQRAGRDNAAMLADRVAARRANGDGPFAALINTYLSDAQLANTERGCILAALSSEITRQGDGVAKAARTRALGLIDTVRRTLPATVSDADAGAVAATMVGALQMARTLGGKAGKSLLAGTRAALILRYEPASAG